MTDTDADTWGDWKGKRCRPGEIRRMLRDIERSAPCGAPAGVVADAEAADVDVCPWCGRRAEHPLCDLE